jgi:spermidine synthase
VAPEYVEIARAASERGEVVLRQRREGDDPDAAGTVELRVNGVFVMDTVETTTERELARAALKQVEHPREVLIGGLGLGFTAHEVLADPRVERVAVVELEEALVDWMRDGTVPHGPAYLADERLHVVVADIRSAVAEATPGRYDLVLLDVDNGPGYLVHDVNAEVYEEAFLARVAELLRTGGALAVWSAAASEELAAALGGVFGSVTPVAYDVDLQGRAEQYFLYLARA